MEKYLELSQNKNQSKIKRMVYMAAYKLDMEVFDDVRDVICHTHGVKDIDDCGIDLISHDRKTIASVYSYDEYDSINLRDISTFYTISNVLEMEPIIIVDSRIYIDPLVKDLLEVMIISNKEFLGYREYVMKRLGEIVNDLDEYELPGLLERANKKAPIPEQGGCIVM